MICNVFASSFVEKGCWHQWGRIPMHQKEKHDGFHQRTENSLGSAGSHCRFYLHLLSPRNTPLPMPSAALPQQVAEKASPCLNWRPTRLTPMWSNVAIRCGIFLACTSRALALARAVGHEPQGAAQSAPDLPRADAVPGQERRLRAPAHQPTGGWTRCACHPAPARTALPAWRCPRSRPT